MIEKSHDDLRYKGTLGEAVKITVEAQNTVQMVTYTLKGVTKDLAAGEDIEFQLEAGTNVLQMVCDSVPPGGSYRVVVRTVDNEANQECVQVFQHGGDLIISDFRFFV